MHRPIISCGGSVGACTPSAHAHLQPRLALHLGEQLLRRMVPAPRPRCAWHRAPQYCHICKRGLSGRAAKWEKYKREKYKREKYERESAKRESGQVGERLSGRAAKRESG